MATFLVTTSPHHHSERPELRRVHDIPDEADPYLHALLDCLGDEHGIEPEVLDEKQGYIGEVLAKLQAEPGEATLLLPMCEGDEEVEHKLWFYPVWHKANDSKTHPNMGVSCDERYWLVVEKYEPNPGVYLRLQGMDKATLVDLLCRVHAEQNYLPYRG